MAVKFLTAVGVADLYHSPENEIAFARIAPKNYSEYIVAKKREFKEMPRVLEAAAQGMREYDFRPDFDKY